MKQITDEMISANMKAQRIRAGYTQESVAKALKISRQTVISWENNPSYVKAEVFRTLANMYGCLVLDFFVQ